MSRFSYLIAEGVTDVVFLTNVLRHQFGLTQIQELSALPVKAQEWMGGFKWPIRGDIKRMAVPAPVFLTGPSSLVGIRNSGGTDKIKSTLKADFETFLRNDWFPETICVILDADDLPADQRFSDFANTFQEQGFPQPSHLGQTTVLETLRSGVFSFPGTGLSGTIEDVLLPIAKRRFGTLFDRASQYVGEWIPDESGDFKELGKPSGRKKAQLSAMAALLKPGKSINASIDDQNWISNPNTCAELTPLIQFLSEALLLNTTLP